jgi:hypothetical protein
LDWSRGAWRRSSIERTHLFLNEYHQVQKPNQELTISLTSNPEKIPTKMRYTNILLFLPTLALSAPALMPYQFRRTSLRSQSRNHSRHSRRHRLPRQNSAGPPLRQQKHHHAVFRSVHCAVWSRHPGHRAPKVLPAAAEAEVPKWVPVQVSE